MVSTSTTPTPGPSSAFSSSASLIRALKAANEPEGTTKIALASTAFLLPSSTLYIPRKHEMLAEFVLSSLSNRKASSNTVGAITDARYWALLGDIVADSTQTHWLPPVLARYPLCPVLAALLGTQPAEEVLKQALKVTRGLRTFALQRASAEQVVDAWAAGLGYLVAGGAEGEGFEELMGLLSSALRSALSVVNPGIRKKLTTTFTRTHLRALLFALSRASPSLRETILLAAEDLLFSADGVARVIAELEKGDGEEGKEGLLSGLKALLNGDTREAVLSAFPTLLSSFHARLPASASSSSHPTFSLFIALLSLLPPTSAHSTRAALLSTLSALAPPAPEDERLETLVALGTAGVSALEQGLSEPELDGVLRTLEEVWKAEPDAVASLSGRVLSALAPARPSTPALALLQTHLTYSSQTRTLPLFLSSLAEALVPPYTSTALGPLASPAFTASLAAAQKAYLTSNQVLPLLTSSLAQVREAWETLASSSSSERPTKRRKSKSGRPSVADTGASDRLALLACPLLTLLDALPSLLPCVVPAQRAEARVALEEFERGVVRRMYASGTGAGRGAAAVLRVGRAMGELGLLGEEEDGTQIEKVGEGSAEEVLEILRGCAKDGEAELALEIVLTLLYHLSLPPSSPLRLPLEPTRTLDAILDLLPFSFAPSPSAAWTGRLAELDAEGLPAAVWEAVAGRLHIFDALASSAQLDKLCALLLSSLAPSPVDPPPFSFASTSTLLLRTASFWELSSIRTRLLALLLSQTTPATFRTLLHFPTEYLSRSARSEFVKRALEADRALPDGEGEGAVHEAIRGFLERLGREGGGGGLGGAISDAETLWHLASVPAGPVGDQLRSATGGILSLCLRTLLKALKPATVVPVSLASLTSSLADAQAFKDRTAAATLAQDASVLLIRLFTEEVREPEAIDSSYLKLIKKLGKKTAGGVQKRLRKAAESPTAEQGLAGLVEACKVARVFLERVEEDLPEPFGQTLLARVARDAEADMQLKAAILSLLDVETRPRAGTADGGVHERFVAAYILFSFQRPDPALDACFAGMLASRSSEAASRMWAVLEESVARSAVRRETHVGAVLHAFKVLIKDSNDSRMIRAGLSKLLQHLVALLDAGQPTSVLAGVANLMETVVSDRAILLQRTDVASILSLISKSLSAQPTHDPTSSPHIFASLTSTLTALIRLRRDLLSQLLPHVSAVLTQLLSALRAIRPNLGAKQTRTVADSLPSWLAPSSPLTIREAKSLARLLTSLTTKTIPLTSSTSSRDARPTADVASSLARAFSKHAPFLLVAYVRVVSDPLTFLAPEVRSELEPGLFALCEMTGEHERGAVMLAMLGPGEKVVFKALWAGYEKQKYTGRS